MEFLLDESDLNSIDFQRVAKGGVGGVGGVLRIVELNWQIS